MGNNDRCYNDFNWEGRLTIEQIFGEKGIHKWFQEPITNPNAMFNNLKEEKDE